MPQSKNSAEEKLAKIRAHLEAMSNSIATTRKEIASLSDPATTGARVEEATGELDAIVADYFAMLALDAAGEPAAHMWPVAVIGVIVFLIPALICFLAAVHWLAGVADET